MGHDQNGICHELLRFHGYFMGFNQPTWYHILALKIHRNNPKSTASSCVWNSPISFWHSHIYRGFKNRGTPKSSSKSLVQIWTEKKPISIHFWWFAIHRAILLGANKKVQCHNVGFMADIYIYIYSLWFVNKESQQLTVAAMVFTQQLRQFPGKTTSLEDNFPVDFSSTAKTKCPVVNIRWGFQLIGLAIQMVYYILI